MRLRPSSTCSSGSESWPADGRPMILTFVEQAAGQPDRSSLEVLTFARRLAAAQGVPLGAVLFGPAAEVAAAVLGAYGVVEAYLVEPVGLAAYAPAAWGRSVAQLVGASSPTVVLAPGTDRGQEVLAYAAAMLD